MVSTISTVILLVALVLVQLPMIARRRSWSELSVAFLLAGALETGAWTFEEASRAVAISEAIMSICFIAMALIVLRTRARFQKLGKKGRDLVMLAMELPQTERDAAIEAIKTGGL